ncbi:hypothetical protein [Actinacidiphila bryophytorum]|uniref:Nucleic acid-binding protein n=1 Tax=Actinacidiphila bryophytorum TaxID=1436133 RepID=A0A9W4E9F5_9ACTN|nr:hypothetical protein [Actinacidiphila bryophytorum]MBM9434608.1 hypothetical protein [Actinacidiphila bryophytorum]MBN6545643.1 hypothetical protein [Actinacidiphila bryophytorum]CAG7628045.1 Putative nucleic acid-binding protein [Actinacidiphila bryophytorum]
MTGASHVGDLSVPPLVWDASPLHHAIKADKIDLLGDIAQNCGTFPRKNVTTDVVRGELERHKLPTDGLGWLDVVALGSDPDESVALSEILTLVTWTERVAPGHRNGGEATVLAWADLHSGLAVIDDSEARRIGRRNGVEVWGSLRVIADSVRAGHTTEYAATSLVDAMIASGMYYPRGCKQGQFVVWAKQNGLL